MKVFFTAWILLNGAYVHGSWFDGWSPLLAPDEQTCETWLEFTESFEHPEVIFTCETLEDTETYIKDLER